MAEERGGESRSHTAEAAEEKEKNYHHPIHWACYNDEEDKFIQLMNEYGSDILDLKAGNSFGNSFLHIVACNHATRVLRIILNQYPPDSNRLNVRNKWGETPLHLAAATGDIVLVKALLQQEERIHCNLKDNWQRTPYIVARQNGYYECANLIKQSPQFDEAENIEVHPHPHPPHAESIANQKNIISLDALNKHKLKAVNVPTEVKHIFKMSSNPSSPPPPPPSSSSLSNKKNLSKEVEFPGDPQRLRGIIDNELSEYHLGGKDSFGLSALHKFASWNKVDLLQMLCEHLSVEELNSPGGSEGYTCLHWAADMGAKDALTFLLSLDSIDFQKVDKKGRTYLDILQPT